MINDKPLLLKPQELDPAPFPAALLCPKLGAQLRSVHYSRVARLEAQLTGMPVEPDAHRCIEDLAQALGEPCSWLDARNAALAIHAGSLSLPIQVLLELNGRGQLGVLIRSREAVGRGAPFTGGVLEQVLAHLHQLIPGLRVSYRSDRDGPVLHAGNAGRLA